MTVQTRAYRLGNPGRLAMIAIVAATLCASLARADDPDTVPFFPQRPGDKDKGYAALISKGWVGCGVPAAYYDVLPRWLIPKIPTLPGRPPGQEDLPYFLNRFTTKGGVEVLAPNCLYCHAGHIGDQLVVGLGNADGKYQVFDGSAATIARWIKRLSWLDVFSSARRAETWKVGDRMSDVAPYIEVDTPGGNPTHNLAWALVMHHDASTLAWHDTPGLPLPPTDAPHADVPPWWWMKKKNAMFAAAGGQGEHTGLMAVNSTLCADSVADFDDLYAYFNDIQAFLSSITPPRFPNPPADVATGRQVFEAHCSHCHGTYGDGGQYPNRVIALDRIGTDPALALYNSETSAPASAWLNASVFATRGKAHYAPYHGYVAPPLDGIWATAPYLHNGSVPTLATLLDSSTRPTYWRRKYDDPSDYDYAAVGWRYTTLPTGKDAEPDPAQRRTIVDTTRNGWGNGGHTFGDHLTPAERAAVIDYLKTL